jgi:putative hydrolase of the HAD superfamily
VRDHGPAGSAEVLLFDVGGVLVDVRRDLARARWTALTGLPGERFDQAVFGDGRKDAFDRGDLGPTAFFGAALESIGDRDLGPALDAAFRAIVQPRPWVVPLVAALAARYRLAILSNIDPVHAEELARLPVAALFPTVALSFRIGARKPEPAAYAAALDLLGGVAAERVLLLDDLAPNVAAARAAGLRAVPVPDEATLRSALAALTAGRLPSGA